MLAIFFLLVKAIAEKGSVCINDCSGYGTCVDYECQCLPGFYGEDCRFGAPHNGILTAGSFNLTGISLLKEKRRHPLLLVGFSSLSCAKCATYENDYAKATEILKQLRVPFGRINMDSYPDICEQYKVFKAPTLILFKKGRPYVYHGEHHHNAIVKYIEKQMAAVASHAEDQDAFETLVENTRQQSAATRISLVVGCFDNVQTQEDEFEDFGEAAREIQTQHDIYFIWTTGSTLDKLRDRSWIDRSPSVVILVFQDQELVLRRSTTLDDESSLVEWISQVGASPPGIIC